MRNKVLTTGLVFGLVVVLIGTSVIPSLSESSSGMGGSKDFTQKEVVLYKQMPDQILSSSVFFTVNQGQFSSEVLFQSHIPGATVYFCRDKVVSVLTRENEAGNGTDQNDQTFLFPRGELREPRHKELISVYAMFEGANPQTIVTGENLLPHYNNYFLGNDPTKWYTDVPNYQRIIYQDVYPGIDLTYYGTESGGLKYDFIVQPEADVSQIQIHYSGIGGLTIRPHGDLEIQTSYGVIREDTPLLYQRAHDGIQVVTGGYRLLRPGVFGFEVKKYNPTFPLVIDPALIYSTYLGGDDGDEGRGIVVNADGYAFVTGMSHSNDFPTTSGAYDTTYNGGEDIIVIKLSPFGDTLVYSTYIGGTGDEDGWDIAVDENGDAYITGYTTSSDYPIISGAYDSTYNGGNYYGDVFMTKLSLLGNTLLYSTYLGGTGDDWSTGVAVDANGYAFITGWTTPGGFPTTPGAYDTTYNGNYDIFITKLSPSGNTLSYSTYLGGTDLDWSMGIAVDMNGDAFITGLTQSSDYPTTPGAYNTVLNGPADVIVAKLSPSGDALLFSTYIGGTYGDEGCSIAVDANGAAYIVGDTDSSDYPTTPGAFDTTFNGESYYSMDVFVTKLSPSGGTLIYSTFLGGTMEEDGRGIEIDAYGDVYATGITGSQDYPTTPDAFDLSFNGIWDVFVTKLSPEGDTLLYSTYLGGYNYDDCFGIAVDVNGFAYVTGITESDDFPTTPGAYDTTYNTNFDGFMTKLRCEMNYPPDKPDRPSGETNGKIKVEYNYTTKTSDANGDQVWYWWDWGDETNSSWLGPFASNTTANASHTWTKKGSYAIKVKAKDISGDESPWSDPLAVSMPLNEPREKGWILSLILKLLQDSRLIQLFLHYIDINL